MSDWFDRMRKAAPSLPGGELLLFGPAQAVQLLAGAVKASLVGRRRVYRIGGREIAAEITDLVITTGPGLAIGQFDGVRLDLRDLDWEGRRVSTLSVELHNAHLRPGLIPTFVAAPVLLDSTIDRDALETWSTPWARRFALEIGDDAVARIRLRGRESLGALEVDVRIESGMLVVDPSAVVAGRRRFGALKRLPAFRVPLVLPRGIRVTDVDVLPGAVRVRALVPEWSESLVITDVQQLARTLRPDLDPVILPFRR